MLCVCSICQILVLLVDMMCLLFPDFFQCFYIISFNVHTEFSMFLRLVFFCPTCQEPEVMHNRNAILKENHHSHYYWLMVDDDAHVSNQCHCMKSLLSRVSFIDCEWIGRTSQEKKRSGRVACTKHHDHLTHWIIAMRMKCVYIDWSDRIELCNPPRSQQPFQKGKPWLTHKTMLRHCQ